jgi:transcriptional regulator with XRE-family HTH domain
MAQGSPRSRRGGGDGPNPIDIHVGARVRQRRAVLGVSQEKLAAEIGVSFQQVQKYENGANRIGGSRLWRLARVLDVMPGFFFADDDPRRAPGFAAPAAEAFDADPLGRREVRELVEAFYRIPDAGLRRRFFELARALATPGPEADRQGRKPAATPTSPLTATAQGSTRTPRPRGRPRRAPT